MWRLLESYVYATAIMATTCFFGVLIATFLLEVGLARKLGKPFIRLMNLANLPEGLSIPTFAELLDSRSALAIVSSLRKEFHLNDSLIIAYRLVTMPLSLLPFIIRYYLPVVPVALGLYAGLFYIALVMLGALIGSVIGIAYGKLRLKRLSLCLTIPHRINIPTKAEAVRRALMTATSTLIYVMKRYVIVLAVIATLLMIGFFDWLNVVIGRLTFSLGFSPQFALILSIHSVAPLTGIFTAGEILRAGLVSVRELLIALLLGRLIFSITSDYPRHAFPFYASLFPSKLAAKLTLVGIIVLAVATPISVALVLLFT